jgi:hypothetical protein
MTRSELIRLLPAPSKPVDPPTAATWARVEADLGTALPDDYKWFVETYGTGQIGEVLWIYNPSARQSMWRLQDQDAEMRTILGELLEDGAEADKFGEKSADDFVCFGSDEDCDSFLWQRSDLHLSAPPVLVVSRLATKLDTCAAGFLDFLQAALEGRLDALGVDLTDDRQFRSLGRK